jgi:hypothetical protein
MPALPQKKGFVREALFLLPLDDRLAAPLNGIAKREHRRHDKNEPDLTRPEAIRRLVEIGVKAKK